MKQTLKILAALMLLFTSSFNGFSQEKDLKKANEEFSQYAFADAIDFFKKIAENGNRSPELLKRLGDAYYFTADYSNAAAWYGVLFETQGEDLDPDYLYKYAQTLKSNGQYVGSDKIMDILANVKGSDIRSNLYLNERNYLDEIERQSGRYELVNVGFNSGLSDFAPMFYNGGLIFASNRTERGASRRIHDWNNQPFLDLYTVSIGNEDSSKGVKKLSKDINTKYHESTAIFTKDGNTMYFTRNNFSENDYREDSEGTNRLKLYRAQRGEKEGEWTVDELPFNSDEYSVSHPALSVDEQTLYFASDMPGGKGLSDLYKIEVNGGTFTGQPVNLGDNINTEGRETFPFISKDKKLYFASDGHVGLGGLDIFVSDMEEDGFGEVYNVGKPVNSPQDDFTFVLNSTTGLGYFASNRGTDPGNDDIYKVKQLTPLVPCSQKVEGIVTDKKTSKPISGATVLLLNENNDIINTTTAATDGTFSFNDELACSMVFALRATKDKYLPTEKPFVSTNEMGHTINKTLFMEADEIPLEIGDDLSVGIGIIYFDLDKDFIRPDAALELNKIVNIMRSYPTIKVDVRSHTDSRASTEYNNDLSSRRNASTIAYLVRNGISASRLTGRGYGESQLVNRCSDGVRCSDAEHQLNRRSEFIIVQK